VKRGWFQGTQYDTSTRVPQSETQMTTQASVHGMLRLFSKE